MRIVLSAEALQPPLTGIGNYTLHLLRSLAEQPACTVSHVRDMRLQRSSEGLSEPAGKRSWPVRWVPRSAQRAAEGLITRWSGADIVHGTNYRLFPGGRFRVVTVHDLVRLRFPEFLPEERRRRMARELDHALAEADLILTPSAAIRNEIISRGFRGAGDVISTPLGVAPYWAPMTVGAAAAAISPRGLRYKGFSLATGTVEPRKNLVRLIAAYRLLPESLRLHMPLVVCGKPGWQSDESFAAIRAAEGEGWLHYIGYAQRFELKALTAGAALAIQASVYEGFCLPLLEAMACGTRVIASEDPALRELAGSDAAILPPGDPARMSRMIEEALLQGGEVDPVWTARAQAMTWERCSQMTLQAYSGLLGH